MENRDEHAAKTPKPGTPTHKPADKEDKSAVGEEDPGSAIEEMDDPHPEVQRPAADTSR